MLPGYGQDPCALSESGRFLISGDLKEPVTLSLERENLELYEVQSSLKDTLRIRRSGWGFLRAEVTVEGDFLEVEKKSIHDGHFIGSVYELEYIIRREYLEKARISEGSGSKPCTRH